MICEIVKVNLWHSENQMKALQDTKIDEKCVEILNFKILGIHGTYLYRITISKIKCRRLSSFIFIHFHMFNKGDSQPANLFSKGVLQM